MRTITIKKGMEQNPELRRALKKAAKKLGIDLNYIGKNPNDAHGR